MGFISKKVFTQCFYFGFYSKSVTIGTNNPIVCTYKDQPRFEGPISLDYIGSSSLKICGTGPRLVLIHLLKD